MPKIGIAWDSRVFNGLAALGEEMHIKAIIREYVTDARAIGLWLG
jgi:hypothetical protein